MTSLSGCEVFIYALCAGVVVAILVLLCLMLSSEHEHRDDHRD